ncbi:MAG: type IV toxin-antitoxin system AbiEi family antitoxin domain-containing protein [Gemmatimonadaceae bacterium]
MANALYHPCYIGGWSAAEHWGLTEQLFRGTFVVTAAAARKRNERFMGAEFHVMRVRPERLRGVASLWRGSVQVAVSSKERTLVDAARNPSWVGGLRHLAEMLERYVNDTHDDLSLLGEELERSGNGAAAKRLGYLVESRWPRGSAFVEQALARRTTGTVRLDPGIEARGKLSKRWGLLLNTSLGDGE